jgi:hypothetical protein
MVLEFMFSSLICKSILRFLNRAPVKSSSFKPQPLLTIVPAMKICPYSLLLEISQLNRDRSVHKFIPSCVIRRLLLNNLLAGASIIAHNKSKEKKNISRGVIVDPSQLTTIFTLFEKAMSIKISFAPSIMHLCVACKFLICLQCYICIAPYVEFVATIYTHSLVKTILLQIEGRFIPTGSYYTNLGSFDAIFLLELRIYYI